MFVHIIIYIINSYSLLHMVLDVQGNMRHETYQISRCDTILQDDERCYQITVANQRNLIKSWYLTNWLGE